MEITNIRVSTDEVLKVCKAIDISKSSAVDGLSSKILKDAFVAIVHKLTRLFNLSLTHGKFPDQWKSATVIPLQKAGDKSDVNNLRPVSLLPLPGKILEKLVHKKLLHFLEINNLLDHNQGGFRPNRSTINTVAKMTDMIFNAMNNKEITVAAFIDFRKAFDTVNHEILIEKLKRIGIRSNLLNWSTDYLTNRTQCTLANDTKWDKLYIKCGVPQGSTLGPLFFLVYINDIKSALGNINMFLFADDTVLLSSNKSAKSARDKLEEKLSQLLIWCRQNKLTMNLTKTKCMIFGTKQKVKISNLKKIKLDRAELDYVNSYKYLGRTLDKSLTYIKHIQSCISNVSHKMFIFSKIRPYINTKMAITIYKTLIVPFLDYGDILFINASIELLNKLQRLQNKCLRICLRAHPQTPTFFLHQETKTAPLHDRRKAHLRNFMFQQRDNLDLLDNRDLQTRQHTGIIFKVQLQRLEICKNNVFYQGAIEWNALPLDIRAIKSLESFKRVQKRWMMPV